MPKPTEEEPERRAPSMVRRDLASLAAYLHDASRHSHWRLPQEPLLLEWAALSIDRYLENSQVSLDHAFGLVRPRGNQGDLKVWAERAAVQAREGLTVEQVAERHHLSDIKSVREGLKRGHEVNAIVADAMAGEEIARRLDRADPDWEKLREADVRRRNARDGIRRRSRTKKGGKK